MPNNFTASTSAMNRQNMNNSSNMNNAAGMNDMNTQGIAQAMYGGQDFQTPPQQTFDSPEMRGSVQQILSFNIGEYVVIEFLIGTERLMRKQGILYLVGTSFVTLYDDTNNNFIICDIFSIKFVYFYYPGQRPARNYNTLPSSNGST